jgi:Ca2+-binding EF-hand superfamily protein
MCFHVFLYCSFSRETPQRFKKEMVKAAQSNDGTVKVDKLNEILINIGRPDQILSEAEMRQLLQEGGANESRSIQAATMMQLL